MRTWSTGIIATSVFALAAPGYAQAQVAPDVQNAGAAGAPNAGDGAAEPQQDPSAGLQDIIVTAQRKEEAAQRAALAISVVGADQLAQRNVTSVSDLSKLLPSVSIQASGGSSTTFFIRGVGNLSSSGLTEPAAAVNFDGIYLGRDTSSPGLLYDLDRIEALKGPQGTLYGRNATAGAINIIPAHPRLGETEGAIAASYGNFDAVHVDGHLNLGIGDRAALRVAGMHSSHSGYLSDGTSDQDLTAGRIQLTGELTDTLTVRASADYAHVSGKGNGAAYVSSYRYNFATSKYDVTPSGLSNSIGLYDPRSQAYRSTLFLGLTGRNAAPIGASPRVDSKLWGIHAEITWKMPLGTLTILPAFRRADVDQINSNLGWPIHFNDRQNFTTVETRLAGDRFGGFLDYILGAYYYHDKMAIDYDISQQATASFQNAHSSATAKAVYARLTGHLTDRFRLVGGFRYTNEHKRFDGTNDQLSVICLVRVAGVPSCPTAPLIPFVGSIEQVGFPITAGPGVIPIGTTGAIASRRFFAVNNSIELNKVNFRAAAEFDLGPRSLLYASFENGFRSGGFQLAPGFEEFKPEYLDAYTVGIKSRLLNNRVQVNVEAFLWKYRDQQISHPGFDSTGNQSFYTENVGRSTNKGVEVDTQFLPFKGTLLKANLQYLDAKYDSFVFSVASVGVPPFTGCPSTAGASANTYTINCSGRPSYQAPKWTINLAAQQSFDVRGSKAEVRVYTQFKSGRWVGFEYLPFEYVGANWTTGAQVSVEPAGTPLTLSFFVENIENNRQPASMSAYALGSSFVSTFSPPRTYGARVAAKF